MKVQRNMEKIKGYLKLPKLSIAKSTTKMKTTADSSSLESTKRFKGLRKLYFQYKSNANILAHSPYFTNRQEQQQMVSLIEHKRYILSTNKRQQLSKQFSLSPELQSSLSNKQYQKVRIKLSYSNSVHEYVFQVRSVQELNCLLKAQIAQLEYSVSKEVIKSYQIIGFETVCQNFKLDYLLHFKQSSFFQEAYYIQPIFRTMPKGKIGLNDFKLIKCLGSGGFSLVYLVRDRFEGRYYALKLINKKFMIESQRQGIIENQRYVLEQMKSQFTTKLSFAFQTKNHFAFILEYCPGGELFFRLKQVKRMSEQESKFYFLEILIGLNYLHSKQIIYRDLKPQNLLIAADGHIKIADFGLAKPLMLTSQTKSYSFCGSPEYMAPEMLLKKGHSYNIDYYCLGALLYELVTGLPPYYSTNQEEIYENIVNSEITFPSNVYLSIEIKNLLKGLLEKNPTKRLGSLYGIKEILIHPWIGKINIKTIQNKQLIPPFLPNLGNFNFDEDELKQKASEVELAIEEDLQNKRFETHFNDQFYYEQPNLIKRDVFVNKKKDLQIKKIKVNIKSKQNCFESKNLNQHQKILKRVVSERKNLKTVLR